MTASTTPLDERALRQLHKTRELEEFYASYDVWTGIRIASTLAVFFTFTVTIILYKSKCKKQRKYELYPSLEDMQNRPFEGYDHWCVSPLSRDDSMKLNGEDSLGRYYLTSSTGSAPLPTKRSVGSYTSLNNSFRVKSLPGSVMRINWSRMSSSERDDASQVTGQSIRSAERLQVPGVRLQSTGSSSDGYSAASSHDLCYDSSMAYLGVPGVAQRVSKPLLQLGGMDNWDSDHATAEWIQTIDINVIQPTPNISPCGSVRSVSDNAGDMPRLALPARGGRSSSLLSLESPDYDSRSIGSDSVFFDDSVQETGSSMSVSDSLGSSAKGSQPYLAAPSTRLAAPRTLSRQRQVQTYRLPVNTRSSPSPVPRQSSSERSSPSLLVPGVLLASPKPKPRGALGAASLLPPQITNLSASCERLARHSSLVSEESDSRRTTPLPRSGGLSTESSFEEPQCAVFRVPNVRRCNSATVPELQTVIEEGPMFRRTDSEAPQFQRSDSATTATMPGSSGSTSESDDASESVSFHLMVPELSIDVPSADTSRASSPSSSSSASTPSTSPAPPRKTLLTVGLMPIHDLSRSPSPARSRQRLRGAISPSNGNNLGDAARAVLRRQYSMYPCQSPVRDAQTGTYPLPTYFEEGLEDNENEKFKRGNGLGVTRSGSQRRGKGPQRTGSRKLSPSPVGEKRRGSPKLSPSSSLEKHRGSPKLSPSSSLDYHRGSPKLSPSSSLDYHRGSPKLSPSSSLDYHRGSPKLSPSSSLDKHRGSPKLSPSSSLDQHRESPKLVRGASCEQYRGFVKPSPSTAIGQHRGSLKLTPSAARGQTRGSLSPSPASTQQRLYPKQGTLAAGDLQRLFSKPGPSAASAQQPHSPGKPGPSGTSDQHRSPGKPLLGASDQHRTLGKPSTSGTSDQQRSTAKLTPSGASEQQRGTPKPDPSSGSGQQHRGSPKSSSSTASDQQQRSSTPKGPSTTPGLRETTC
ncbi:uncharacterized protein LOC143041107 [Oratosquilla oratoria]|uniref:uncharacterized protein LOC143041107 n=1 Tax=Oratosquilla oratoria TaxID=337810 RepID=UPI003F7676F5